MSSDPSNTVKPIQRPNIKTESKAPTHQIERRTVCRVSIIRLQSVDAMYNDAIDPTAVI